MELQLESLKYQDIAIQSVVKIFDARKRGLKMAADIVSQRVICFFQG